MRRDDPLVDAALAALAAVHFPPPAQPEGDPVRTVDREVAIMTDHSLFPSAALLEREARRVLACLSEPGAVLAVAEQMDKAVVVRAEGVRTAVVGTDVAQAMALKDWIACSAPGRVSRYRITGAGRAALRRLLAEAENRARADSDGGFSETQAAYDPPDEEVGGGLRRCRYGRAESPLAVLARRKDRDGQPFLDEALVRAGERLREDFELAQLGPRVAQNWDRFLTGGVRGGAEANLDRSGGAARDRVARALSDLGPGLGDVALRCCCYLEGLEQAERRMGWSARSGKIVLRIALQRLRRHYDRTARAEELIG